MLTPGQLGLVEDLESGTIDAIEPEIAMDLGGVTYPMAGEYLDQPVRPALEELVDTGALEVSDGRDCTVVLSDPHETVEIVLETYGPSDGAADWVEGRLGARQATADLLERRGFDVTVDTTIPGSSGTAYPVHVHASDAVLDLDVAVGMAESVIPADIISLAALATDTGARPILVTLTESAEEDRAFADRHGIGVVRADDGTPEEEALAAAAESED